MSIESRRMSEADHVARMGEMKIPYKARKREGRRIFRRPRRR
jgi:hypothetical protein